MQWFYAKGDQRVGPIDESELQSLVQNGTIVNETLVWRAGMSQWQPYAELTTAAPRQPTPVPSIFPVEETEVCAVSGKRYPRREMIQYQGQWVSAEYRDTFFQRLREGVPVQTGQFQYAGFWIRFAAKLIDGLIMWVVAMVINLLFGLGIAGVRPAGAAFALFGVAFILQLGCHLLYYWFFLNNNQATPGKMALGLKVVRADGSRLTSGRIIGRFFSEIVSGLTLYIGYIIAGFDEEKRALHDHICDTRVIKAR